MTKVIQICHFVLLYLFVLLSFSVMAQDNISLENLSVNDGLSQATVNDIYQDDEGFLWVSTENGLNLYDGYRFRLLPGPSNQFENAAFYKVKQDSHGLMWLISSRGLFSYNKQADVYQSVLSKPTDNFYFIDIVESNNKELWIASNKMIFVYDLNTKQSTLVADLSKELPASSVIFELSLVGNTLFVATRSGVFVINVDTRQWKKLPSINQQKLIKQDNVDKIYNIYGANNGQLYIGTFSGIYRVSIQNIDSFLAHDAPLDNYKVVDENIDSWSFYPSGDALYVGSSSGLLTLNLTTNKLTKTLAFNDVFENINKNVVTSMVVDKQGMFWLGSLRTGLFKWDPSRNLVNTLIYRKTNVNRLSDNVVWDIEKSKDNAELVWIATENGLNAFDKSTGQVNRYLVSKKSKNVYSESYITQIEEDNFQRLWLLTYKGVKLFDTKTRQLITPNFKPELLDYLKKEHFGIYVDDSNFLWSLTDKKFRRINIVSGEVDDLPELEQQVQDNDIFSILGYLPNTTKMLLSTNDSLVTFDVKTRKSRVLYQLDDVAPSDWAYIDSWVIDDENILWLAFSSKGLIGLDADTFEPQYFYNKQNSGIDNNVYGVLVDGDGDLWFSSHNGIYHLDRKTQHIRNFNTADGLSAREFNGGAFEKISNSLFAYGSINGVSFFDPSKLKHKDFQNQLLVHATNVDVLSRHIKLPFVLDSNQVVKLHYDDIGIRFDFSALTYRQQNLHYSFQLKGNKLVTYPETTNNFITFPSLPSGDYVLSARVRSPYTGEYSPATEIRISVSYAPWASPIAYVIYFSLIAVAIGFYLKRKRKFTEQLISAHEQVKFREQRLSLALHGSNSDVWDWRAENNMVFGSRASDELGFDNLNDSYSFDKHIELIHDSDREAFMHQWQNFIDIADLNDNFSCSYRLRTADGEWLWYKDLGKIVEVDAQGTPIRVTGSYTNITQSRAAEERAQYYGDAFKQTKDWVLIISDHFTRVIVNQSLKSVFGWQEEEFSFDAKVFGLSHKKMAFYKTVFRSLKEGDHWRGEELVTTKSGQEFHVLLNINVSLNTTTNSLHYVCIFTDITAQKHAENELRYLANYDHLTDLPNRSLLLERIKHGMEYSSRISRSIALFFIDLDRFKQVNDSLGHDYGDLLLQEITLRLKQVLRVDDTVARIGGDEFVILLESFSSNSQLGKIAQKLIDVVGQPVDLNGHVITVGASIGIALYPDDADNSDELLKNADVAMYHAKQLGRNTFQFFTPRMNVEASQRLSAESSIRTAHENDEFINHYQPIVDSVTGKAKGVELLLRWQQGNKLIMPGEFISIAEEIGLIIPMTERALERALTDLTQWLTMRENFFVSINLSANHFAKSNLVDYLTTTLEKYQISPTLLKLEITESTLIKEPEQVIAKMTALAKLGVAIAIDDFGTGYSSLNYLKKLPLDVLKIDKNFIDGIGKDSADEAIVDATLVLANNLCMNCIAEGVETKEQLSYLAERQCYAIQGYLYSKPVNFDTIIDYLRKDTVELTV